MKHQYNSMDAGLVVVYAWSRKTHEFKRHFWLQSEFTAGLGYRRPSLPEQRAAGMAQWPRTHADLAEDQSSFPSTYKLQEI